MLPFEYKVVGRQENFLNSINSSFGCAFDEDKFEIKTKVLQKQELKFYKCTNEAGFTVFSFKKNFMIQVFGLDLDGSAEGISDSITVKPDNIFILKNHPKTCFIISEKVEASVYKVKDESSLASFDFSPFNCSLTKFLNTTYVDAENIQKYCDEFCEKSILTLNNIFSCPVSCENYESWPRAGPSDFRSFKYTFYQSSAITFMNSKEFMTWLSAITGLPLLYPEVPIYTRCLQAAGDYQILHGNYSEPYGLDVIFSFYPSKDSLEWPEETCGRIHYLNDAGDEIFQVNPLHNSLTLVYRTEGCTRFTENVKGFPTCPLFQTIAVYTVVSEEE